MFNLVSFYLVVGGEKLLVVGCWLLGRRKSCWLLVVGRRKSCWLLVFGATNNTICTFDSKTFDYLFNRKVRKVLRKERKENLF